MTDCFYDCYAVLCKIYSEKAYLKQALASTPVEEKRRALTVKTCYGVLDRDAELSYYISALTEKTPKLAVRIVLKIAVYHIKYLGKRAYAVTDGAVALVKKLGKGGVAGFVNAFLRRFAAEQPALPDDPCLKFSYPRFAVDRLYAAYGKARAESIMSARGGATTLAFYGADGEEYLSSRRVEYEKTPFEGVFSTRNFVRNADYDAGVYTFQNVCSAAICEAVGGGKRLFDACAAPGGKSVYLSGRFDEVVAEELYPHRAELIRTYAARMKRGNIKVVVGDARAFESEYEGAFDAVLCDAPCTGFGVAFENPDVKLGKDENTLKELCALQKEILFNVARYVCKGGALYYSTCSFFAEENDGSFGAFLESSPDFAPKELDSPLPHERTEHGLQFLPDAAGGGFYIAAAVRKK